MGLFFTLSGFVIMHVYDRRICTVAEYANYLQKRLARMYPLHLATLALAIFLGTLPGLHYWFTSADDILPNILLVHAWNTTSNLSFNLPSWSVSAEFFVYLLFPVFLLAINFLGLWWALLLPIICVIANEFIFKIDGLPPWNLASYDFGCLRAAPSFVAGMVIYRFAMVRFASLVVPGWLAHGVAIATIPMMLLKVHNVVVLATFALAVFLLAKAEPERPGIFSTPLFRALANCSYGFYMLHFFIADFMLHIVPQVFHLGVVWQFGLCAPALVVTTLISILSFHLFEDPARRYFGALGMRQANSIATGDFAGQQRRVRQRRSSGD